MFRLGVVSAPMLRHGLRLIVMLLALASQIGTGALLPEALAAESPSAALARAIVLCQSSQRATHPDRPVHHSHARDQALARSLAAAAQPALLAEAPAGLPPRGSVRQHGPRQHGARAPPGPYPAVFYPTGPPSLV